MMKRQTADLQVHQIQEICAHMLWQVASAVASGSAREDTLVKVKGNRFLSTCRNMHIQCLLFMSVAPFTFDAHAPVEKGKKEGKKYIVFLCD